MSTSWTTERARVASLTRSRKPDDPDLLQARRALAIARVEQRVREAVESSPPLPADVEARLRDLIRSVGADREAVPA